MSIEVRGNLPGLQQAIGSKFAYNVVPMPSITAADGMQVIPTGGGSLGWGLAPNAVHNPLALAFLHYLFSAAGQAVAEKTFGVVPAVASLNGPTALWRTQAGGPANSAAFVIAANSATIAPHIRLRHSRSPPYGSSHGGRAGFSIESTRGSPALSFTSRSRTMRAVTRATGSPSASASSSSSAAMWSGSTRYCSSARASSSACVMWRRIVPYLPAARCKPRSGWRPGLPGATK